MEHTKSKRCGRTAAQQTHAANRASVSFSLAPCLSSLFHLACIVRFILSFARLRISIFIRILVGTGESTHAHTNTVRRCLICALRVFVLNGFCLYHNLLRSCTLVGNRFVRALGSFCDAFPRPTQPPTMNNSSSSSSSARATRPARRAAGSVAGIASPSNDRRKRSLTPPPTLFLSPPPLLLL